ncbi:MAG: hypothetical protein ACI4LE_06775, partial [Faecalibacterium sp.]
GPRSDFCKAAQGRSTKSEKRNPSSFFSKKEQISVSCPDRGCIRAKSRVYWEKKEVRLWDMISA